MIRYYNTDANQFGRIQPLKNIVSHFPENLRSRGVAMVEDDPAPLVSDAFVATIGALVGMGTPCALQTHDLHPNDSL